MSAIAAFVHDSDFSFDKLGTVGRRKLRGTFIRAARQSLKRRLSMEATSRALFRICGY